MKITNEQSLYIQKIYCNAGKTIMDKIFEKYSNLINTSAFDKLLKCYASCNMNDFAYAFIDALCNYIISKKINCECPCVYIIFSPYHNKKVIYGIVTNQYTVMNIENKSDMCFKKNLYTCRISKTDAEYISAAKDLFRIGNSSLSNFSDY